MSNYDHPGKEEHSRPRVTIEEALAEIEVMYYEAVEREYCYRRAVSLVEFPSAQVTTPRYDEVEEARYAAVTAYRQVAEAVWAVSRTFQASIKALSVISEEEKAKRRYE